MTTTPAPSLSVIAPTGSATGPWPTGFRYGEAADVRVYIQTDGVAGDDLTRGPHYTLTGANPTVDGGSVTLALEVVPVGGWSQGGVVHHLVIQRRTIRRQGLALPDTEGHRPRQTEAALDKQMRLHEEHAEGLGRTLAVPVGEAGVELPPADARANGAVVFGASGEVKTAAPLPGMSGILTIAPTGEAVVLGVDAITGVGGDNIFDGGLDGVDGAGQNFDGGMDG